MSESDVLRQQIIELQTELANLRRSEYIARAGRAQALDAWFPDALLHLPFDGDRPYETMSALVNLYGHQLQRPAVATGGIIGRPGQFAKAVQAAETTTNLVTNPSIETNTTGWGNAWGDTLAASAEQAKFGLQSLKVTGAGAAGIGAYIDSAVTPGATYTASVWVYVSSAGWPSGVNDPGLRLYDGAGLGTLLAFSAAITERDQWVWRSVTATPAQATARILVFQNVDVAGRVMYIDGVQLEAKAYPTPYCDGSLGPGHAWTGTAHASTSTRVASRLTYAAQGNIAPLVDAGTVSLWLYMLAGTGTNQWFFGSYNNAERIYLYWNDATKQYTFQVGASTYLNSAYGASPYGRWIHLVMTWTGGVLSAYEDGALLGTGVANATRLAPGATIDLGNNVGAATYQLNGYLDDVLVLDRALTATEVRRLYEAGQAAYPVAVHNTVPGDWRPTALAVTAAGQTMTNGVATVVNYGTVEVDTAGGITTGAAWSYLVRRPGPYRVTATALVVTAGAFVDNELLSMSAYVNGTPISLLDYARNIPAAATHALVAGSTVLNCVVGDLIDVRVRQDSGADRVLLNNDDYNRVTIEWIG